MPGLRRQPGISSYTNSIYHADILTPAPAVHQYSWHCENSIISRPIAIRQVIPRQPLRSQKGTRDKCNYLGTKAASTVPAASVCYDSMESDDLLAMVHDFIENDPSEHMNGVDSDDSSSAEKLVENLLVRISPSVSERELAAEVKVLLILINGVIDVESELGVSDCEGSGVNHFLINHLKLAGYDAAECKSKWHCTGRVPGGEYEYIDVILNDGQQTERLIVDVHFQAQFMIARPTQQYEAALKILPAVFVGSSTKLKQILEFMSEAAKASLQQSDMHLPPWRTLDYMSSKWLSTSERKTDPSPASSTK